MAENKQDMIIVEPEQQASVQTQRVFISYGRADALEFVQRLATDLKQREHRVWLDLEDIEKGGLFDVRVERGIRDCTVFIAVMTTRSVAEDSVCRDEVVFALNQGKDVVPIRADSRLNVPLMLARRNWIDFTDDYDEGLKALALYLSGDPSALREPRLPSIAGMEPLDFSVEIARFSAGFTGREWLNEELDRWLSTERGKGAFVIVGEPGAGKSSIAAWLSVTRPLEVVGVYFCTGYNTRSRNPYEFVASLVGQLQARVPGFADAVERRNPAKARPTASDCFRELIVEPVLSLDSPPRPQFVIVDSLDEALLQSGESVIDVLVKQVPALPAWLRFVATTRPEKPVLDRIRGLNVFELNADQPENVADLRKYVRDRLAGSSITVRLESETTALAARIESLAEGNFLYAQLTLDALEEGSLSEANLGQLTPGLSAFYSEAFRQCFPSADEYRQWYAPILRVLAAAHGPVPLSMVQEICEETLEQLHSRLLKLHAYLRLRDGRTDPSYVLFHRSIVEWLTNPDQAGPYFVDAREGLRRIADCGWKQYRNDASRMSKYAVSHLAEHLAEMGWWDKLIELTFATELDLLLRWKEGGESETGIRCLQGLIVHLEKTPSGTTGAAGLASQLAQIYARRGAYDEAERWLRYGLKHTSWWRGRRERAMALHELGSLFLYKGASDEATKLYETALRLCRFGIPVFHDEAAANLVALATVSQTNYLCAGAEEYARKAIHHAVKAKDLRHLIASLRMIASAQRTNGQYDEANAIIASALELCESGNARVERCRLLLLKAWLLFEFSVFEPGSVSESAKLFQLSLSEAASVDNHYSTLDSKLGLGWCALAEDDPAVASSWFQQIGDLVTQERHFTIWAGTNLGFAVVDMLQGRIETAARVCEEVIEFSNQKRILGWGSRAYVALGTIQWHSGRSKLAEGSFSRAIEIAARISPAKQSLTEASIRACKSNPRSVPR